MKGENKEKCRIKNPFLVSKLRPDFTKNVYTSIAKIKVDGIKNTKYEAIKSGHILLNSPPFCRGKMAFGQLHYDILGVKTRRIKK